jgi:hypothetical protein
VEAVVTQFRQGDVQAVQTEAITANVSAHAVAFEVEDVR